MGECKLPASEAEEAERQRRVLQQKSACRVHSALMRTEGKPNCSSLPSVHGALLLTSLAFVRRPASSPAGQTRLGRLPLHCRGGPGAEGFRHFTLSPDRDARSACLRTCLKAPPAPTRISCIVKRSETRLNACYSSRVEWLIRYRLCLHSCGRASPCPALLLLLLLSMLFTALDHSGASNKHGTLIPSSV